MADKTAIEWTDATWSPITGCSVHSAGCTNCYAMQLAGTRLKHHPSRKGLTREVNGNHVWTGEVRFNEQWLLQPLQWKRPRDIFVCAHADLFHENVPDEWIDKIFAVMALAPQHRFQVLTKRSDRMREYVGAQVRGSRCVGSEIRRRAVPGFNRYLNLVEQRLPLPNVLLGVSVEDQRAADERIPDLLATPAAIRWLSCEPLLGPVDLTEVCNGRYFQNPLTGYRYHDAPEGVHSAHDYNGTKLDWIVVGGESGRNARPMHPDWARSLRDQCAAAGVPFHFKQWGEWKPFLGWRDGVTRYADASGSYDARSIYRFEDGVHLARVGKKAAGRLLDGVLHDGRPA